MRLALWLHGLLPGPGQRGSARAWWAATEPLLLTAGGALVAMLTVLVVM